MKTCARCGGGVAEPNEVTGWAGKWCHCGWANDRFTVPFKPLPEDMSKIETPTEYVRQLMRENAKNNVQKPSMSHIINLCEQLSMPELRALIDLLKAMHDIEACSSSPEGLKPNAPSPYEVKGL